MSLAVGLGVVAAVAATWGAAQRAAAARARAAAWQAERTAQAARDEATAGRAMLDAAQARLLDAEGARGEAEERARRVETAAAETRRALAESAAERARLARLAEEGPLLAEAKAALEQECALLKGRVAAAERTITQLREPGRDGSRAYVARMEELDRKAQELAVSLDVWARRAQAAEAELARRDTASEGAPGKAVLLERDALRARVEALESALRQGARLRAGLRALGVPEPATDADLFSPERRAVTDGAVREVYLATSANAAALVDTRGVAWSRFGMTRVVERLAATVALVTRLDVEAALGAPARLISEQFGVYGRHVALLPGAPVALALFGSRECPALPLRLASLRLVGAPGAPGPGPAPMEGPALDPALSDRLDTWAARRRAVAAAVVGGSEPAATDSSFAAACALLADGVRALHARALRDGFAEGFGVAWRAEDDATLAARVLDDGRVAFARFAAPPTTRVLDDLHAAVRWADPAAAAAS